jgi:DNA-binding NtrC family response regulator
MRDDAYLLARKEPHIHHRLYYEDREVTLESILIIDDDLMMLNALTTLLEAEDYSIKTSPDGEDGIRSFREHKPDVVLLDLRLPAKNGIEVLKEIKRVDTKAKVIIITGFPTPEVREEAMAKGAFYFYEKTSDINDLLQAVKKALVSTPK